jgi:hypothetical protein
MLPERNRTIRVLSADGTSITTRRSKTTFTTVVRGGLRNSVENATGASFATRATNSSSAS